MRFLFSLMCLAFTFTGFSAPAPTLQLSLQDSASFAAGFKFPIVSKTSDQSGGVTITLVTRRFVTADGLLSLSCTDRFFESVLAEVTCSVDIDREVTPSPRNSILGTVKGRTRITVADPADLQDTLRTMPSSRACAAKSHSRLFATQENRLVTLPNGNASQAPLLAVYCRGSHRAEELVIDVMPRG